MTRSGRCLCGHPADTHEHYRPGTDCSECSRSVCPWFVPIGAPPPPTHILAATFSDAHAFRNLAALAPLALPRELPQIPAQRRPPGSLAGEFARYARAQANRRAR